METRVRQFDRRRGALLRTHHTPQVEWTVLQSLRMGEMTGKRAGDVSEFMCKNFTTMVQQVVWVRGCE